MFKPNFIFNSFLDITPDFLRDNNIKALLLDVDNTLTYAHRTKKLRDGAEEWFSLMRENGIGLIVLSNAERERAKAFGESIGLPIIGGSAKPLPFGYLKAAKQLGLKRRELLMVGDQIFTDTLGARLSGIKAALVTDITPEEGWSFRLRRRLEKIILRSVK